MLFTVPKDVRAPWPEKLLGIVAGMTLDGCPVVGSDGDYAVEIVTMEQVLFERDPHYLNMFHDLLPPHPKNVLFKKSGEAEVTRQPFS
jgi:hypothetical protein